MNSSTTPAPAIHPNLKLLSFSSRRLLHNCPRKFELYRLLKKEVAEELDTTAAQRETVHLDFGHLVGYGCQLVLMGINETDVWLTMFTAFKNDLEDGTYTARGERISKSFYHALHAINQFSTLLTTEPLSQYELVWYDSADGSNSGLGTEPATELSFRIDLGDNFYFRGKLDALLKHKISGRYAILETKTTSSSNINEATFRNSEQGLGYSVIVDAIAHANGETVGAPYDIIYPVYQSKQMQWTIFRFPKSSVQRALWLKDIMFDVELIKTYSGADFYPMRGNNCYSYYRQCEYFEACDMSKQFLGIADTSKIPILPEILSDPVTQYNFRFTIEELIAAERAKILVGFGDIEWDIEEGTL